MSYVAHDDQTASIGWKGMLSQLGINFALGAGTLIVFSFLRPRNKIVYAPKIKYSTEKKQLPKLDQGLFSWVKPVLTAPEPMLIEKIGLDAVMFLRFVKLCRDLFFALSILGLAVLAVNLWRTLKDQGSAPTTDNPLQVLSISYVSNLTWLWVHVMATWLFSFLVYYFLYDQYAGYKKLKLNYFRSEEYQHSLHARTLLITGIPSSMQSDQGLEKYFKSLKVDYPISQAHIGRKVDDLPELIQKHDETVRKLESVLAKYLKDPDHLSANRPTHSVSGVCGSQVDSIDYYTQQIEALEEQIAQVRGRVSDYKPTNYGFISFKTISYAHAVAKKFEGVRHGGPKIMLAPQPKDIIWSNITIPRTVRGTKRLIGHGLFTAFCFLWFIPLGMLSSAAQIDHIVRIAPWTAKVLYYNDFVTGLFEAWMTPLIMALFFLLLPIMLEFLSKQQGKFTKSSLNRAVLAKLFLFFLINSLIFYTLSSTFIQVWGKIKAQINDGNTDVGDLYTSVKNAKLVDQIATSLISVSLFWINYISLRGVGTLLDLAQVAALVLTFLRKRFLHPTPRNLKELTRPPTFDYANYYNLHLFFFTVGILYSVIAPLILIVCFVYFSLASLVYRYQLMYVFTTKIETGGTFWRVVFNRFIVSTLFWQIVMIGVMNLKGAHIQSVAVIPLPFLTIAFKLICARKFDGPIRYYLGDNSDGAYVNSDKNDRVETRFGDPALHQELITPMVFSNVRHLLHKVYRGRVDEATVTRRGTIRAVSTIFDGGHELKIQSVNPDELEIDEDAFYDEQNPGYYNDEDSYQRSKDQGTGYPIDQKGDLNRNVYQQKSAPPTAMSLKDTELQQVQFYTSGSSQESLSRNLVTAPPVNQQISYPPRPFNRIPSQESLSRNFVTAPPVNQQLSYPPQPFNRIPSQESLSRNLVTAPPVNQQLSYPPQPFNRIPSQESLSRNLVTAPPVNQQLSYPPQSFNRIPSQESLSRNLVNAPSVNQQLSHPSQPINRTQSQESLSRNLVNTPSVNQQLSHPSQPINRTSSQESLSRNW